MKSIVVAAIMAIAFVAPAHASFFSTSPELPSGITINAGGDSVYSHKGRSAFIPLHERWTVTKRTTVGLDMDYDAR